MKSAEVRWEPTLPNKITFARIVMAAPIALLHSYGFTVAACILFALACVSDLLDGTIARWQKCETAWGHLGDPVADKLCCTAAFLVCFDEFGSALVFSAPMLIIFGYDALVIWMRRHVEYMPTLLIAKWKTFFLMGALSAGLTALSLEEFLRDGWFSVPLLFAYAFLVSLMHILLAAAAGLAILSALQYTRTRVVMSAPVRAAE